MGIGVGRGDNGAYDAATSAITNDLLEFASIKGAKGLIVNALVGPEFTLCQLDEIMGIITERVSKDANIISGYTVDESLEDEIRVTVIATGAEKDIPPNTKEDVQRIQQKEVVEKGYIPLKVWEERLNGKRGSGELFAVSSCFSQGEDLDIPAVRRINQPQAGTAVPAIVR